MLSLSVNLHRGKINKKLDDFKWSVEDYRRHWKLSKHCHKLLYAKSLPNTYLITDECKYFWQIYSAKRRHDKVYEKDKQHSLSTTLAKKSNRKNLKLKHILISEQLINLDKFFYLERKHFIDDTASLIKQQSELEIFCLEGLGLTRKELFKLLEALIPSKETLKFIYLWRAYKRHEYSLPIEITKNKCNQENVFLYQDHHWFQVLKNFNYIHTLALNYSYIASETGDILIALAQQLNKNWRELQLLCLEDEQICSENVDGKINAVAIPDEAWIEVRKFSKKLKVQFVLYGIREYHLHKRYLTQSIQLQSVVLYTDIEILHHKPCMLDCTFKLLYYSYHRTLVELYLNLWNHREMLDNHLRKIFTCLPNLEVFEYLGVVRDAVTIFTMCCKIKAGVSATKRIIMKLQKPLSVKNEAKWMSRVDCIVDPFKCDFYRMGVTFEVTVYPC